MSVRLKPEIGSQVPVEDKYSALFSEHDSEGSLQASLTVLESSFLILKCGAIEELCGIADENLINDFS
jgi:hypothetical protein